MLVLGNHDVKMTFNPLSAVENEGVTAGVESAVHDSDGNEREVPIL